MKLVCHFFFPPEKETDRERHQASCGKYWQHNHSLPWLSILSFFQPCPHFPAWRKWNYLYKNGVTHLFLFWYLFWCLLFSVFIFHPGIGCACLHSYLLYCAIIIIWASLVAQMVKNLPAVQETWVRFPGSGRLPGGGNGYPFKYSCLENSMDRGAWQDSPGDSKSWTWLSE